MTTLAPETPRLSHLIDEAYEVAQSLEVPTDDVVGRTAVALGNAIGHKEVIGDPSDQLQEDLAHQLNEIREVIGHATLNRQEKLGKSLLKEGAPVWMIPDAEGEKPAAIVQKLTEKDDKGKYLVPDRTLLNVLEWHNMNMEKKRAVLEAEIAPMRTQFVERLRYAVAQGWLPAEMLTEERIKLIMETPIALHDEVQNDPHLLHAAAAARQEEDNPSIVFITKTLTKKGLKLTFFHEMVHIISGDGFDQLGDDSAKRHYEEDRGAALLMEAVTEQFARALVSGNINAIHPFTLRGSYGNGFTLLKGLCRQGRRPIQPAVFARALLAGGRRTNGDQSENTLQYVETLKHALAEAFPGVDVIKNISQLDSMVGMTGKISRREIRRLLKDARKGSDRQDFKNQQAA